MKQIFTNIDLSGNAIFNLVIGSLAADPANVGYGFVYRNSLTGKLRVYTDNGWEDLVHTPNGKIIQVVTSFDKDEDDLSFKLDGDEFSVNVKAKDGSGTEVQRRIETKGSSRCICCR